MRWPAHRRSVLLSALAALGYPVRSLVITCRLAAVSILPALDGSQLPLIN